METNQSQKSQRAELSLESLLQLKRQERPSADFWQTFDRQFQQKRLQALVGKRSRGSLLREVLIPRLALVGSALAAVVLLFAGGAVSGPGNNNSVHSAPAGIESAVASVERSPGVSSSELRAGVQTAFAMDVMHLGSSSVSRASDSMTSGYGNRVQFATGGVGTLASSAAAFY